MATKTVRDFSKRGDAIPVPPLTRVQGEAYGRLIQLDTDPLKRDAIGIEGLLREVFPIEAYDGSMRVEYLYYKLDEPRYTIDECKELRLTYGRPFKIGVRFVRDGIAEVLEDSVGDPLASELMEKYTNYKESRQEWADSYREGLNLLGFKYITRTEPFRGASSVTHPVLAEAVTQFQAQAYKELLPADGPVRTQILGA